MSAEEKASLCQCEKIFGGRREIVFVVPEKLDCSPQINMIPSARIERFDNSFFSSVSSYNRLLLTTGFYERFSDFDYMLIYQPDAWVFRDELDYWCEKNYDYIGGPFVLKYGKYEQVIPGNGGFSLRRISAFLRVLNNTEQRMFSPELLKDFFINYVASGKYWQALRPLLRLFGLYPNKRGKYLKQMYYQKFNSEDMIFYFLSSRFTDDGLTMPDISECSLFSLDVAPQRFFQKLPFGAHAWMKDSCDFWKEYIKY